MIMYNADDCLTARRSECEYACESIGGLTRETELVNALLEIRDSSESGSYEMGVVDQTLGKLGFAPWKGR
jgi:hypothetical protein|tara:strand:- start:2977 stop:3186 length:210 start_codon:yes stop_codon:yes gene_type:complete